jgi:DNA-binding transcriptional LysR family regulator
MAKQGGAVELRHLRYFRVVAEELNYGRAAARLHMEPFLAPAIKQFRTAYEGVSLDLQMFRPAEQDEALSRNELDVGFAMLPISNENFEARTIARLKLVMAVPASDPLAAHEHVSWPEIDGRNTISFARIPSFTPWLDAYLAERGVRLSIVQEADDGDGVLALVGVGLGIAFVPPYYARARDGVTFLELPDDECQLAYAAIWRRNDDNPLRARFVETVAATTSDEATQLSPSLLM